METVTSLWSFCAALAAILAAVCGGVWLIEKRDYASLMLSVLGIAATTSAFFELGLMRAARPDEYGELLRWYHLPVFFAFMGVLLFVHYYLRTGRSWLMWAVIVVRSAVLIINFSVQPNFNFSQIISLRQISFLGEMVSVIGNAVPRLEAQPVGIFSIVLLLTYVTDAAVRRWRQGANDSKRKALAVFFGIGLPVLCTFLVNNLLVLGFAQIPITLLPWVLGALLPMSYEWARDVMLSRRARLQIAELQSQLAQVDRVSLMGQLASSLSHELSQPLTAATANAKAGLLHLRTENPDLEDVREILDDVGRDLRRAAEIISRMRLLFKQRAIEMQPLRVEEVLQDVLDLVRQETISKRATLRVLVQPGLPRVVADRVHLTQVILNLVMNAIHALQANATDSRRIVIEARADDVKNEVEISVADSGPGIPASAVDHLFQPFFTTKPEGTGIGLALSQTIIEAHGGRLWYDETPRGGGAVFRFTLRAETSLTYTADKVPSQVTTREAPARQVRA